jgi:hypothetical protein
MQPGAAFIEIALEIRSGPGKTRSNHILANLQQQEGHEVMALLPDFGHHRLFDQDFFQFLLRSTASA